MGLIHRYTYSAQQALFIWLLPSLQPPRPGIRPTHNQLKQSKWRHEDCSRSHSKGRGAVQKEFKLNLLVKCPHQTPVIARHFKE